MKLEGLRGRQVIQDWKVRLAEKAENTGLQGFREGKQYRINRFTEKAGSTVCGKFGRKQPLYCIRRLGRKACKTDFGGSVEGQPYKIGRFERKAENT